MSRASTMAWLLPTILCCCLSLIYLLEWKASRDLRLQAASDYSSSVEAIRAKLAFEGSQTRSMLKAVQQSIERLSAIRATAPNQSVSLAPPSAAEAQTPNDEEDRPTEAAEALPGLPSGIAPLEYFRSIDPKDFYADARFNPEQAELDRVTRQKAVNVIEHAKAKLQVLQSDLHLHVVTETEQLAGQGHFVEYQKGQEKPVLEGLYTVGEPLPGGGMRLFSLYPDDHPEVYAIQDEMREVSETAIRRLMALCQP